MKITAIVPATVALALGATLCAVAQKPGPAPGGPPPQIMRGPSCPATSVIVPPPAMAERAATRIGLTDEQKTKLKTVLDSVDAAARPLKEKASTACQALRDAVISPDADEKDIKSLADAAERAEAELLKCYIDGWAKVRAMLTKEQMEKLQVMMAIRPPLQGGPAPEIPGPTPGPGVPVNPPPQPNNNDEPLDMPPSPIIR